MANETTRAFHVLIIGAGSTGLLIAQGLTKAGVSCQVYERDSAYTYQSKSREWGMALHWGMESLRCCLPEDIQARLNEARTDPFLDLTGEDAAMHYYNGKTGELLYKARNDYLTRISRSKLRKLLSEGIEIKFNKELVKLEDEGATVRATFGDGEEAVGDLLIGCDGSRSPTREYLLGEAGKAKKRTDLVFFNFTQRYDAQTAMIVDSLHPLLKIAIHPEGHGMMLVSIQDRMDPAKPETWLFQVVASWFITDGRELTIEANERMRMLKELAKHYPDPWRTAALAAEDHTFIPQDCLSYWETIPWDNHAGKITLAGDAAHPMLPHRGQGLNNALEDAVRFIEAVVKIVCNGDQQDKVIDSYEQEMISRGGDEVRRSNQQCDASLNWEELMKSPLLKHGVQRVPRGSEVTTSIEVTA